MAKEIFKPEDILNKLREAEVLSSQGKPVAKPWGSPIRPTAAGARSVAWARNRQRLKALERENAQLRKVVADLPLDNALLKEAVRGK